MILQELLADKTRLERVIKALEELSQSNRVATGSRAFIFTTYSAYRRWPRLP